METVQFIKDDESPTTDRVASRSTADLLVCQLCKRQWAQDTEQAACIRLFDHCIVCRVDEIRDDEKILLGTAEILEEQRCYNEAH